MNIEIVIDRDHLQKLREVFDPVALPLFEIIVPDEEAGGTLQMDRQKVTVKLREYVLPFVLGFMSSFTANQTDKFFETMGNHVENATDAGITVRQINIDSNVYNFNFKTPEESKALIRKAFNEAATKAKTEINKE